MPIIDKIIKYKNYLFAKTMGKTKENQSDTLTQNNRGKPHPAPQKGGELSS